jgi:large subunit ribosomal protein L10
MQKEEKARVVAELTERLKSADTLIVADYRGLTMPQIDDLRGKLLEHGAKFTVVKNTLTRRAAKDAGAEALFALLEGPSAIAFIDADGDMVAVAKALADSARETRVLAIRGGILNGREITGEAVEELSKLPPVDVLRGQVLAAVIAPLTSLAALVNAPLQNLYGLIDARIEQLGGEEAAPAETPQAEQTEAPTESASNETTTDTTSQIGEADLAEDANPEEEQTDGGS